MFAEKLLSETGKELTPLMRQYLELKVQYSDCLLFFRLGDFYELFYDDARCAARELEITLTSRNKNDPDPVPMCGVPFHSVAGYINKLVANGYRVAISEQIDEPNTTTASPQKLVKREVVRVVSPGTQLDPSALNSKSSNYTHAALLLKSGKIEWATCDFTTGTFYFGCSDTIEKWSALLESQMIVELLLPERESAAPLFQAFRTAHPKVFIQNVPEFYFSEEYASQKIGEQFQTTKTESVHPQLIPNANGNSIGPIGALIKYFQESQKAAKIHSVLKLSKWGCDNRFELDSATVRALELLPANRTGRDFSLLSFIDRTKTAMGGRLLKDWILRPLMDEEKIRVRLAQVKCLRDENRIRPMQSLLNEIYDLERLSSRISMMMANARDLRALASSILKCKELIVHTAHPALQEMLQAALQTEIIALSEKTLAALVDIPPLTVREGGMFNKGYNAILDETIDLTTNGEAWLAQFEATERKNTGVSSLKVRFNRVFGYYIEVTKSNLGSVPLHYVRKQTMVGGERYITEELKAFEEKILTSERKRNELEFALFRELCISFSEQARAISAISQAVAHLDCIVGFSDIALEPNYCEPILDDSVDLEIIEGRHPTVALMTEKFVANSVVCNSDSNFLLITGPNMGGKSTVMRQTALIVLLAQMGSYVPAKKARIGIVDQLFTRIGASDNIAEGSSTFMVEMSEMSSILRNATHRSLILLDEVGRGTSTFDGLSLAWALAADIAERIRARTLFATHYHELTRLGKYHPRVSNHKMAVALRTPNKEKADQKTVRFLYKLEPGAAERSYGILVARLAGLPESVLDHAQKILEQLESQANRRHIDHSPFQQTEMEFLLEPKPE